MKKFIIIFLLIIILVLGGGIYYVYSNIYNSKQKELGILITEQDKASLEQKITGEINQITGEKVFEAELTEAEASILLQQELNSLIPCSHVQTVITAEKMVISMTVNFNDELKDKLGLPIPLPEQAGMELVVDVQTIDDKIEVDILSATVGNLSLPVSLIDKYTQRIEHAFINDGYQKITLKDQSLHVSGIQD